MNKSGNGEHMEGIHFDSVHPESAKSGVIAFRIPFNDLASKYLPPWLGNFGVVVIIIIVACHE